MAMQVNQNTNTPWPERQNAWQATNEAPFVDICPIESIKVL
jgi:hypothetical protein